MSDGERLALKERGRRRGGGTPGILDPADGVAREPGRPRSAPPSSSRARSPHPARILPVPVRIPGLKRYEEFASSVPLDEPIPTDADARPG
jgi:hypothetical protein